MVQEIKICGYYPAEQDHVMLTDVNVRVRKAYDKNVKLPPQLQFFVREGYWKHLDITRKIQKFPLKLDVKEGYSLFAGKLSENRVIEVTHTLPGPGYLSVQAYVPELRVKGFTFSAVLAERGGGETEVGRSTIICGPSGEKLVPFKVVDSGHLANGTHALFGVKPNTFWVEIDALRSGDEYSVCLTERFLSLSLDLSEQVLWHANDIVVETDGTWKRRNGKGLPEKVEIFRTAVQAAIDKANCYHCREPHYVQDRDVEVSAEHEEYLEAISSDLVR